ncbi:MAG TPA: hypothetical protein VMV51_04875, partial [Gemmatimonadaceae bacterium]|nr:hypothetical protein [Gemmatimonadaceae bacterium]
MFRGEERIDGHGVGEIEFGVRPVDQSRIPARAELALDCRAHQAAVTGYVDLAVTVHGSFLGVAGAAVAVQGFQSAMKMSVSPRVSPWRSEAQTNCFPS